MTANYGTLPLVDSPPIGSTNLFFQHLKSYSLKWITIAIAISTCVLYSFTYQISEIMLPIPSSPTQIHLSIAGIHYNQISCSWITKERQATDIMYSREKNVLEKCLQQSLTSECTYIQSKEPLSYITGNNYRSGYIHHITTNELVDNTTYYYVIGDWINNRLSKIETFRSPQNRHKESLAKLAILGDLGQSEHTRRNLLDLGEKKFDAVLALGDLSYADNQGKKWDSWAAMVSQYSSKNTPWMVVPGNHDEERDPMNHNNLGIKESFVSFQTRFRMPSKESDAQDGNLYYSFNVANVHVIMLTPYRPFSIDSKQYQFLVQDLAKINRTITPWVVVGMHAPWYSTNQAHYSENLRQDMRKTMEKILFQHRVDLVVSGHVHAYEHILPVYDMKINPCGPHYIVAGNAGNEEGLNSQWVDDQPEWSTFRSSQYGYGIFQTLNETHAQFSLRETYTNSVDSSTLFRNRDTFSFVRAELREGCQRNAV